ncbi:uncharacterized protein [Nothobranchius furzeri]|uniref:uncharacterized protein isoform X2 n=1 Tax=Nothobranchius furzeri TaxID=105023 RepID=UPI003904A9B2
MTGFYNQTTLKDLWSPPPSWVLTDSSPPRYNTSPRSRSLPSPPPPRYNGSPRPASAPPCFPEDNLPRLPTIMEVPENVPFRPWVDGAHPPLVTSNPEPPPGHEEEEDVQPLDIQSTDEEPHRLPDWVFSEDKVDRVKMGLLHLVNMAIKAHLPTICHGCKIDHPSQRQHECLYVAENELFYDFHFTDIIRRVLTPKLIPALQSFLSLHGFQPLHTEILFTMAVTQLHGFRAVMPIHKDIFPVYDRLSKADLDALSGVVME